MSNFTDPDGTPSDTQGNPGAGAEGGQNTPGVSIDDYGTDEGAKTPLSPEEYAAAQKEIKKEGDHNESGHASD